MLDPKNNFQDFIKMVFDSHPEDVIILAGTEFAAEIVKKALEHATENKSRVLIIGGGRSFGCNLLNELLCEAMKIPERNPNPIMEIKATPMLHADPAGYILPPTRYTKRKPYNKKRGFNHFTEFKKF